MGFNERLKEARLAAGLTGDKLGEAIGCSKQNISHWEAGRFEPNLTFLAKLCEVLDVPADWLLLGKVPVDLSAAALKQARYYESLSPDARRRFEMMRMVLLEGASDATVESRMPVTKNPDFGREREVQGRGMKGGVQMIGNVGPTKKGKHDNSDEHSRVPRKNSQGDS